LGGGEDAMDISAASAHAFGEVRRLTASAVAKLQSQDALPAGTLELLNEAITHAREAVNGDKDENPMIPEKWNPQGWTQARQAAKADWVCKALEANFDAKPEIQRLGAEATRLVESLSMESVFPEEDGDNLDQVRTRLCEAVTSNAIDSPEMSNAIEDLTSALTKCLNSLPKSPTEPSPYPLLPTRTDPFQSCVKYVDSISKSNAWTRRKEKMQARIIEGGRCRTEMGKIKEDLKETRKTLTTKKKEASLLQKKIKQLEVRLNGERRTAGAKRQLEL